MSYIVWFLGCHFLSFLSASCFVFTINHPTTPFSIALVYDQKGDAGMTPSEEAGVLKKSFLYIIGK